MKRKIFSILNNVISKQKNLPCKDLFIFTVISTKANPAKCFLPYGKIQKNY